MIGLRQPDVIQKKTYKAKKINTRRVECFSEVFCYLEHENLAAYIHFNK